MITSDEIKRRLWNGANELRGSMDASRYKDYMLGLMFYKFLSDKTLATFKSNSGIGEMSESDLIDRYAQDRESFGEGLDKMLQNVLGYYVLPEYLYQTWLRDIDTGDFEVQKVIDSLNNFERTVATTEGGADFKGLFANSTIDLTDTALGSNLNERSKNIRRLILLFADLNMVDLQEGDVLGDAYEYLIGMFAMESGKKAGEFYTPSQVSEVMAQIVTKNQEIQSIYDPTVGSGSLLLTVGKHLTPDAQRRLNYYGQEKNTATYNLTRMNLLLHGVRPGKMTINNADTLAEDWPEDPEHPSEAVQFDSVVMNPPYSLKNWNRADLKISDPRFEIAGVLPPDSKGDFAFLLHGLYHLNTNGTMAIVLPHGVLFRGAAEGEIRRKLLEKNYIDTIIGLPSNLFTNTGIPVCVIILKKNRKTTDPVLIIDASKDFIKVGKQNQLQDKDIARIVDTYASRNEEIGFSHLADREEIIANEYNLNIPRYIESADSEIPQDVDGHLYGGIPESNIQDLSLLQKGAKDVLNEAFKPLRPGYVTLETEISDLQEAVLSAPTVVEKLNETATISNNYIQKYWEILTHVDKTTDLVELQAIMLEEIKDQLQNVAFINHYEGYQIIADIWKNHLSHDSELISQSDFYTIGRQREANYVTKGSGNNKRQEQDGWTGTLIPNELIEQTLYQAELEAIEDLEIELSDVEQTLSDLVESAKEEDTPEQEALYDVIKKNADDEPQDSFDNKLVKDALKVAESGSSEHQFLQQVTDLTNQKSSINRKIKAAQKDLKEAVHERIIVLTDEEIDTLVMKKWFGETTDKLVNLVKEPLLAEIDIIKELNERYSQTLDDIDQEIDASMKELEAMMNELVVR